MLFLLWPLLINPVLWFSIDLPILGGLVGVGIVLSGINPALAWVVALF